MKFRLAGMKVAHVPWAYGLESKTSVFCMFTVCTGDKQVKRYILSTCSDAEKFCSTFCNLHSFEELLKINLLIF